MPLAFIETPSSIVVTFYGGLTKTVRKEDTDRYNAVKDILASGGSDERLLAACDPALEIAKHASGMFGIKDGVVWIDGESLPDCLSKRILAFVREALPFEPLIKLWANIKLNPNPRARTDLYGFLEKNGHPITADGCFIAYRAVQNDWMDKYSKTIKNFIGAVVSKPRTECDPNPEVTCSRGLHAASYNYARNHYGSGCGNVDGDRLLDIKVNPKDVVAIPTDYNNEKMRVCEYVVLAENKDGVIVRPMYDPPADDESDWEDGEGYDDGQGYGEDEAGATVTMTDGSVFANDNWKSQKRDRGGRFLPKR